MNPSRKDLYEFFKAQKERGDCIPLPAFNIKDCDDCPIQGDCWKFTSTKGRSKAVDEYLKKYGYIGMLKEIYG